MYSSRENTGPGLLYLMASATIAIKGNVKIISAPGIQISAGRFSWSSGWAPQELIEKPGVFITTFHSRLQPFREDGRHRALCHPGDARGWHSRQTRIAATEASRQL